MTRRRSPVRRYAVGDPAFRELAEHAQWTYFMLCDQPRDHDTLTLTPRRWSGYRDDLTEMDVVDALDDLAAIGWISLDWDNQWLTLLPADPKPRQRRPISAAVRRAVFNRDGRACVLCGGTQRLSLDHILRYRDGGPDTADNLRVLCTPCNVARG